MKKFKFKVGDLVRAKRSADYKYAITNTKMGKAVVEGISGDGLFLIIIVLKHSNPLYVGKRYHVGSKHFTKITPKPKIKGLAGKKAVPKTLKGKK